MRLPGFAAIFFMLWTSVACSCPGQTEKSIFGDDFSDDSGGWDVDANAFIKDGAFQFKADSKNQSDSALNLSFNATDGDYCVETVFPMSPPSDENIDKVGMYLLTASYKNSYIFGAENDGTVFINRVINDDVHNLMFSPKTALIKKEPGAINTLRAVVKNQTITFYVNGQQVKLVRAAFNANQNKFGVFGGSATKRPETERITSIKSFNVTAVK